MSDLVFTPAQREEALGWLKANCSALHYQTEEQATQHETDLLIDMYFKLKNISFNIKPNEFLVAIQYVDAEKVKTGEEAVSIALQNPHKIGQYDEIAHQVLVSLLYSLKQ